MGWFKRKKKPSPEERLYKKMVENSPLSSKMFEKLVMAEKERIDFEKLDVITKERGFKFKKRPRITTPLTPQEEAQIKKWQNGGYSRGYKPKKVKELIASGDLKE